MINNNIQQNNTTKEIDISSNSNTDDDDQSYSFIPLRKKYSSFWPTFEELVKKNPSLEFLNPSYDSNLRKSSPFIAILNLLATVVGGGVLSLPLAFSRAGIYTSTLLMIFSAIMTNFCMYILCSCARRTGGRSYGDVTRKAFGNRAEIGITVLLFIFLFFVIAAYFILMRDTWSPIIFYVFPDFKFWIMRVFGVDDDTSFVPGNILVVFLVLALFPLLLQKDLHALRHTCYFGFFSIILLVIAISKNSYTLNFVTDTTIFQRKAKFWAESVDDVMTAFPIIALAFFSIYNVLSVHSALVNPTRERVKFVLDGTIILCFCIFYIFGLSGYMYAYDQTLDNILLNFHIHYSLLFVGRVGFGFTLLFGFPLVLLPCREALLSIPTLLKNQHSTASDTKTTNNNPIADDPNQKNGSVSSIISPYGRQTGFTKKGHYIVNGINFDEERPLLVPNSSKAFHEYGSSLHTSTDHSDMAENSNHEEKKIEFTTIPKNAALLPPQKSSNNLNFVNNDSNPSSSDLDTQSQNQQQPKQNESTHSPSSKTQILSTILILSLGFIFAVNVPGVGTVWSICGSSLSLIIGFFIPAACYLKIRSKKRVNPRSIGAWFVLVFSILASVVCTYHSLSDLKT